MNSTDVFDRARASYALIEAQLRHIGLPYNIAYNKSSSSPTLPSARGYPLSQSIPALAVSAAELFRQGHQNAGDKDVEDHVAIEVIGWWNAGPSCKVATSVRLKHAPPVSADLRKSKSRGEVLRITPKLYYNTATHVVTFVSETVEACVPAFLAGWMSVRRLIVIARESEWWLQYAVGFLLTVHLAVVKMHKTMRWRDVKLLSSDLQQVVFQYFQVTF